MASSEKKEKSTPDILRMGKKRISDKWNNSRGWHEARTAKLRYDGKDWEENSSAIFKAEKDDEKHHQNYWDTPKNEKWRGWTKDENVLKAILHKEYDRW